MFDVTLAKRRCQSGMQQLVFSRCHLPCATGDLYSLAYSSIDGCCGGESRRDVKLLKWPLDHRARAIANGTALLV